MNREQLIAGVVALFLILVSIVGYEFMLNVDNKEMAQSGLEQCAKSPDWSNSGTIWVKDCDKYMLTFAKEFKDD